MKKEKIVQIISKIEHFIDNNCYFVVALLAFPHICHITFPYESIAIFDFLLTRFIALSFILTLFIYFAIKKRKPSKLLILITIFCIWATITTFINNPTKINKMVLYDFSSISLAMIVEMFCYDLESLIKGLIINFEIQIYPNLITVFIYHSVPVMTPGYNNNNLFLGTRNDLILYLLPAACLAILYYEKIKKSFRPIVLIAAIILTIIFSESTTTLISFVYFCIMFVYCYLIKKNNIKHPTILMIIPIIIYFIVVVPYFVSGKNVLIDYVMNNIYYKHSFEARTLLWTDSKKFVLDKPLLGYGYYYEGIELVDNDFEVHCIAHNTLIQTALNYGVIGLILFISIFVETISKLCKNNNCFLKTIYMCFICSIMITFISQDYHRFFEFYIVIFLAYYIELQMKE